MATSITAITGGTPANARPNRKQFQAVFDVITTKVSLTDATLPAQTSSQVAVSVPGAAVGDFVLIAYPTALLGGVLKAEVSAADVVTVTLFNTEGTDAITSLAGGLTANIAVLKPVTGVFGQN